MSDQPQNPMTRHCYQRIVDEMTRLWEVDRPKIVDEVQQAAAQGDRSENAEYIYGKKKLREIDSRVTYLERKLKHAKIIDPELQKSSVIDFGATVEVELGTGEARTFIIVGEDEAAPEARRISWKSPIGRSLLNKKPGDYFEVETPKGTIELTVVAFRFEKIPPL